MPLEEYEPLMNNIKRYVALDARDEEEFLAIVRKTRLRKRQYLVQPGFVCQHQTYILQGALRSYFVSPEGQEHTIQFAVEDWFISDFNSYISQSSASLFVEALEDSIVLQISYEDVENLCADNIKFEHFFRVVAQKSFAFAQRRILSNLGLTAEERYREFSNMYPHIVQRVPQYALASYLGMTPEFLSTLKSKLARKS
ncbi:Crp/Fnr family transcriptional regulator [Flavobacteriaceae bacterium M23B6Z8]